jgi:hypothetical protein
MNIELPTREGTEGGRHDGWPANRRLSLHAARRGPCHDIGRSKQLLAVRLPAVPSVSVNNGVKVGNPWRRSEDVAKTVQAVPSWMQSFAMRWCKLALLFGYAVSVCKLLGCWRRWTVPLQLAVGRFSMR